MRAGVPVELGRGGDIERELAYDNQYITRMHVAEVWEKALGYVKMKR